MKRAVMFLAVGLTLLSYTKWVWQSAFDQGADVSMCIGASFAQSDGTTVTFAKNDPACVRAKAGERNPLWVVFRRRSGG